MIQRRESKGAFGLFKLTEIQENYSRIKKITHYINHKKNIKCINIYINEYLSNVDDGLTEPRMQPSFSFESSSNGLTNSLQRKCSQFQQRQDHSSSIL